MRLKSRNGFSITEILVTTGLFAIIVLAALFLASNFYKYYHQTMPNIGSEVSLLTAARDLHRALSLAADLSVAAGSLDGVNLLAGQGAIRDYKMDSMGSLPGKIDTVAVFLRETGGSGTPPTSQFIPTGIFYSRPSPTKSGVLFIDSQVAGPLSPKYSGLFYDKIVELSISNFYYARGIVTSAEVSITFRRFLSSDISTWNFCPQKDIDNGVPGCVGVKAATFNDVNFTTRVSFSNQIVNTSDPRNSAVDAPYERLLGNIYLFPQR